MEINKNNYQVWITDYYDGSLSESAITMLNAFLDRNPELRDEFNSYGELVLHPDISIRIDKDSLRKDLGSENKDAIEYYALALSENDLDAEMVLEFGELEKNSEMARSEAAIYSSLKLNPGNTAYPDKSRLKRIPYRSGFAKNAVRVLAVAASLALLVTLSLLLPREAESNFTYNNAYLLPFNSSSQLPENKSPGHLSLVNPGRVTLKEITINQRNNEAKLFAEETKREVISVDESPFLSGVSLTTRPASPSLVAMKNASPVSTDITDQGLSPRQYIAMNFRKHLLKEDVNNTNRLKAHEVADVSIDGLNKLLGWDMSFEKEKTEEGRLTSFKFSSQLLNLDHKFKKVAD